MEGADDKSPDAFRTISEVAAGMDLPQHVLRFWETRFPQIKPLKRGGGRRYYRPDDVELLRAIKRLLYDQGYTIKGVQKLLREQGAQSVMHADPEAAEFIAAALDAEGKLPVPKPERVEPTFSEAPFVDMPQREDLPRRGEPKRKTPSAAVSRLTAADTARLRGALAEMREAERQLTAARNSEDA